MKYFCGQGTDLGTVEALPQTTFAALCEEVLSHSVQLAVSREAFHELPRKEQDLAKRVAYIVPAAFKTSPSHRNTENALHANLLALDIDDPAQASRLIEPAGLEALAAYGHIAWHTASSTAEAPRLRLLVQVEAIPIEGYRDAIHALANLLGFAVVNKESKVAVQPMFLPTTFADSEGSPIVAMNAQGQPFVPMEAPADVPTSEEPAASTPAPEENDVADLTYYRAPLEGITLEEVREALTHIDPDLPMHDWIEMAAALKHQFDEKGYELWDSWSAKGNKYVDAKETEYRWGTLKARPVDREPVTIRSLFKLATENGWDNRQQTKKLYETLQAWLKSEQRSSEELMDQGPAKIAQLAPSLAPMELTTVVMALRDTLKSRGMTLPLSDIRKAVKKLTATLAKAQAIEPWAQGWCYLTSIDKFYQLKTGRRMTPKVIDLMFSSVNLGSEEKVRPQEYIVSFARCPQVENVLYDPARYDHAKGTSQVFVSEGIPYVNLYRPSRIKSDLTRAKEAGDVVQAHLAHLIREPEYRTLMIDFMAYHFQHPGKKINWAPLIQSGQGAGKSFLGQMMSTLLGSANVKKVSNSNIMEDTHNEWAYGAQLAVMDEVRVVGQTRHAVMDKLKPCITDDRITLRAMYDGPRTVPNIQNYLLFTNHHDALAIQDTERRYFVISSPLQQPDQIERLGGAAYFTKLFGHLDENAGGLKHWLEHWPISPTFVARGRAPTTKYMHDLVMNAASPLANAVMQALQDAGSPLIQPDLVSIGALRASLDFVQTGAFSEQALASVLRELGWEKRDRTMLDGTRHNLWTKGDVRDPVALVRGRLEVL